MNFIVTILKLNMATNQLIVWNMQLTLRMFMICWCKFDFSNYCGKSKHYDSSNALVVSKMKFKMYVEEFVGLKLKCIQL